MSQTPYLGSKISLISRLDIRYEGTLYTVDSNESTIALAKVRSFGTEDRPTAHPVKARDEVYEYIIFKASDIKDLVVVESPPKQPDLGGLDYDPAIVSVSKPPPRAEAQAAPQPLLAESKPSAPKQAASKPTPAQQSSSSGAERPTPPYHQKQQFRPDNRFQQQQAPRQAYQNASANNNGNRPFHPAQQQPQQAPPHHQQVYQQRHHPANNRPFNRATAPKEKLKFDSDFDFEKANEAFKEKLDDVADELEEKAVIHDDDEESGDENSASGKKSPDLICYDKKSSFFDDISCEALEKAQGKNTRPDWRKERQVNSETFGQQAVRSQAYHYRNRGGGFYAGGGGGGYRGGRGGPHRYYSRPDGGNNPQGGFNPNVGGNRPPPRYHQNRDPQQQGREGAAAGGRPPRRTFFN